MAFVIGFGSFVLFLSLAVNIVALLVPYWSGRGVGSGETTAGLWGSCKCQWEYSSINEVFKFGEEDWFISAQWLYALGVVLMCAALLALFLSSCCRGSAYGRAMIAAGVLMLIAAMCVAVSLILYGVYRNKAGVGISGDPMFLWGYWLGVAGFGVALISAIIFLASARRYTKE